MVIHCVHNDVTISVIVHATQTPYSCMLFLHIFVLKIKISTVPRIQPPRIFPFHWLCMSLFLTWWQTALSQSLQGLYCSTGAPTWIKIKLGYLAYLLFLQHHIIYCSALQNMFILDCSIFSLCSRKSPNYLISHNSSLSPGFAAFSSVYFKCPCLHNVCIFSLLNTDSLQEYTAWHDGPQTLSSPPPWAFVV